MGSQRTEYELSKLPISVGVFCYMTLVTGLGVMDMLAEAFPLFPMVIFLLAYCLFGFIMNRVVLPGVTDEYPFNSIYNASSSKLRALILWPIFYPVLFFNLAK
jgi:hypothetical protein